MDEQTLEPCPFCAKSLRRSSNRNLWWHPGTMTDGDCVMSGRAIYESEVAIWNHRAAHSVIAGKVAELEEALRRIDDHESSSTFASDYHAMKAIARAALAPYPERRHD